MAYLKILCLGLLIFPLAGGALADVAKTRAAKEKAAAPLIEAALTRPMPELYAATQNVGSHNASLILGLAMMADRRLPQADQDGADMDMLASLETRLDGIGTKWRDAHPGTNADDMDWDQAAALTGAETEMLDRVQKANSANYWLSIGLNAASGVPSSAICGNCATRNLYLSSPTSQKSSVGAAFYSSGPAAWTGVGDADFDTAMTAIQCIESVREQTRLPADGFMFYRLRIVKLKYVSEHKAVVEMLYDLRKPDPKRDYATGTEACGGQIQHYLDLRAKEALEPSVLRTRFNITQ